MSNFIDRRQSAKGKSTVNRRRLIARNRDTLRKQIEKTMDSPECSVRDLGKESADVRIPKKNLREPVFQHGVSGRRETVHPGNKEYMQGDRLARPEGGSGGAGGGQASSTGEGEDDFVFTLSPYEFLQLLFERLELPNLTETVVGDTPATRSRRSGHRHEGPANQLALVRTLVKAQPRRNILRKQLREELRQLEAALETLEQSNAANKEARRARLRGEIERITNKLRAIPFIDPLDEQDSSYVHEPIPEHRAVMVCMMDVSGSMTQKRKDLAKRYLTLLYFFLQRAYSDLIDLVFIRHTQTAKEVTENEFFYSKETGGTIVSSSIQLALNIIRERYLSGWNVYAAHASDGDNWDGDPGLLDLLVQLGTCTRFMTYTQVAKQTGSVWPVYEQARERGLRVGMEYITSTSDVLPAFRRLSVKR